MAFCDSFSGVNEVDVLLVLSLLCFDYALQSPLRILACGDRLWFGQVSGVSSIRCDTVIGVEYVSGCMDVPLVIQNFPRWDGLNFIWEDVDQSSQPLAKLN